MKSKTQTLEDLSIPMAITQEARRVAQKFAQEQPTPPKAEQVYFNTLAVCMVNNYLRILGIPTNLTAGDSWDPVVRLAFDVADLEVTGLGRLECRPLKSGTRKAELIHPSEVCYIPPEVQSDRIGYVAVSLDDEQQEATLLGFVKTVATSELRLSELQSMDQLLEYLAQLKSSLKPKSSVALSQWLEGIFEAGWQVVKEALLGTPEAQLAFRGRSESVKCSKLIELGRSGQRVELIVTLISADEPKMDMMVEVHPPEGQTYLPRHLGVMLLDEEGEKVMEAQGRDENQNIQFELSGEVGDYFSVKVALDDVSVTEDFVI